MLNIGGLKEGVVIDHIKAGRCHGKSTTTWDWKTWTVLWLSLKTPKATKWAKKILSRLKVPITVNLEVLGVLDENITINVIQDNKIVEKKHCLFRK